MLKFNFKGRKAKLEGIPLLLLLIALGVLLLLICSLVSSAIILSLNDPGSYIGVGALCAIIFSGGICGAITSLCTDGNIRYSLIVSGTIALILLVVPLFAGGKVAAGLMNSLCYFGLSVAAAPIFKKKKRKRR